LTRGNLGNEFITIQQNITTVQDVVYQVSFYWRFNLATSTTPAFASARNNADDKAIANATLIAGRGEWLILLLLLRQQLQQELILNFQAKNTNNIDLPKIASGIYFVKLQHENGSFTKKIILE
jgi:hypothetical protein